MRVLVVGAGPAGATAARQARGLGANVTLVEAKRLGGTSLNEGAAPIRTLAQAARLLRDSRSWERFGLRGDPPQVDIAAALANARRVANYAHEQKRLADFVRSQGIDLIEGAGPAVCSSTRTRCRSRTGRPSAATPSLSPSVGTPVGSRSPAPNWR